MSRMIYTTNKEGTIIRGSIITPEGEDRDEKLTIALFCKEWISDLPWEFCDIPKDPSYPSGNMDGWILVITPEGVKQYPTYQGVTTLDWAKFLVGDGRVTTDFVILDKKHDGPIPSINIWSYDYYYGDDAIVSNMRVK